MLYRIFRLILSLISNAFEERSDGERAAADLSLDENDDVDENDCEVPSEYHEREDKVVLGTVTHLYDNYGLVDGYIYFHINDDCPPSVQLNEVVSVQAVREARHTGWKATIVTPLSSDWHAAKTVSQVTGIVTSISNSGHGVVNSQYRFSATNCKSYEPWRGDSVIVTLINDGMSEVVETVQPFSMQTFTGRVVHVGQRFSFIDGDIAFTSRCCINSYIPYRGDMVTGSMVSCDQGQRWVLRALTVSAFVDRVPAGGGGDASNLKGVNADYIFIEGKLTFEQVPVGSSQSRSLCIRNGTKDCLKLLSVKLDDSIATQFNVSNPKLMLEGQYATSSVQAHILTLLPGMTASFTLTFQPRYVGEDSQELVFTFKNLKLTRKVSGVCTPSLEQEVIDDGRGGREGRRYRQIQHNIRSEDSNRCLMPGVRPQYRGGRLPRNLPQHKVPERLRDCVLNETREVTSLYPQIEHELTNNNYVSKISTLLHLEEINAELEIRRYDIAAIVFGMSRGYLTLVVEGLPDGQPKLVVGDKLTATVNSDIQGLGYEAYIHDIRGDSVFLKFHSSFHDSYCDEECSIIFHINRMPFRRMHTAATLTHQMAWPGLFPNQVAIKSSHTKLADSLDIEDDSWLVNKSLNMEQRLAVKRVLQGKCRPYPYVIFGPPGTGKTVTLTESVVQVFDKIGGSRVLLCAPSNSAADLLTTQIWRCYKWPEHNLVRLISYSRQDEALPEEIRHICEDGSNLSTLALRRVIVSTCVSAGMLLNLGLSLRHFTHVFIDEAGQASEPECLIPIALAAANPDAVVVLAGDHQQLGAVVKSKIAEDCGLTQSLLERTMQFKPYARQEDKFKDTGSYDPNLVTKLIRNYRAHPFILSLYSRLFYDNELQVSAGDVAFSLQHVKELSTDGKPIIFHGLLGEELRDGTNPSWFNAVEVVQIVKYLQVALQYCSADKIGVITPYRQQVEKIRHLMESVGVSDEVKVGSVEEFQGQERLVVLVSTVRSQANNLDACGRTSQNSLGFLANCKRFNVSISRAQALLVVVGNPMVLSQDKYWRELIDYCVQEGCYVGTPYPPPSHSQCS